MAPVTPCVSLPTLWHLPTSLKQVGAKSQPCPCLEGSHSHPGLPEAVKSSLGTQSHLLLLLNESPSISCRDCTFSALTLGCATGFSVSFTSLATLNILQGRALCLFPCTHSPASCKPGSLLILVSSNLSDLHSAVGRREKTEFYTDVL